MSRGLEFSRAQVRDAIKKAGGNVARAAKILGCERRTLYNYIGRYKALGQLVQKERQNLRLYRIDVAEHNLDKALEAGDWRATEYVLSTQGKSLGYTRSMELDHGGQKDNPMQLESREAWLKSADDRAQKAGRTLTE